MHETTPLRDLVLSLWMKIWTTMKNCWNLEIENVHREVAMARLGGFCDGHASPAAV
jgi:hypothetical protein